MGKSENKSKDSLPPPDTLVMRAIEGMPPEDPADYVNIHVDKSGSIPASDVNTGLESEHHTKIKKDPAYAIEFALKCLGLAEFNEKLVEIIKNTTIVDEIRRFFSEGSLTPVNKGVTEVHEFLVKEIFSLLMEFHEDDSVHYFDPETAAGIQKKFPKINLSKQIREAYEYHVEFAYFEKAAEIQDRFSEIYDFAKIKQIKKFRKLVTSGFEIEINELFDSGSVSICDNDNPEVENTIFRAKEIRAEIENLLEGVDVDFLYGKIKRSIIEGIRGEGFINSIAISRALAEAWPEIDFKTQIVNEMIKTIKESWTFLEIFCRDLNLSIDELAKHPKFKNAVLSGLEYHLFRTFEYPDNFFDLYKKFRDEYGVDFSKIPDYEKLVKFQFENKIKQGQYKTALELVDVLGKGMGLEETDEYKHAQEALRKERS